MNKKFNILIVGYREMYINRTQDCFIQALRKLAHVNCYGPGYSTDEELKTGVYCYYNNTGPYDFVIVFFNCLYIIEKVFGKENAHCFPFDTKKILVKL